MRQIEGKASSTISRKLDHSTHAQTFFFFSRLIAVCMYTHVTIASFYLVSMSTVDLDFPIIQGLHRIGQMCACKHGY